MQQDNVKDLFKQFCKERHAEDKGRNFDMLQEIYANTELFDLSFVPYDDSPMIYFSKSLNYVRIEKDIFKNLSLPFENQFIKLNTPEEDEVEDEDMLLGTFNEKQCVFLREYAPNIITGTVYAVTRLGNLNMPFTIKTLEGKLSLDVAGFEEYVGYGDKDEFYNGQVSYYLHFILKAVKCLCNLPKHSVVSDTPKRNEYYTRKHGSTIKVCKPIYYVLNKDEEKEKRTYKRIKPLGHLAFDHSFKVIGHWRRISPHTYGKNRQGEYVVTGMTWVKEHTRGEGELIKKIRVVK